MRLIIMCLFVLLTLNFSCKSYKASLTNIENSPSSFKVSALFRWSYSTVSRKYHPIYRVMNCDSNKECSPVHFLLSSDEFLTESELPDGIFVHHLPSRSPDKPFSKDRTNYYQLNNLYSKTPSLCEFENNKVPYREYVLRIDGKVVKELDSNTVFTKKFEVSYVSMIKSNRMIDLHSTRISFKNYQKTGPDDCYFMNQDEIGDNSIVYILGEEENRRFLSNE